MKNNKILIMIIIGSLIISLVACGKKEEKYENNNNAVIEETEKQYKLTQVTDTEYQSISMFDNGIAYVKVDNKFGVINTKGEYIIPLQEWSGVKKTDGYIIFYGNKRDNGSVESYVYDSTGKYLIDGSRLFPNGQISYCSDDVITVCRFKDGNIISYDYYAIDGIKLIGSFDTSVDGFQAASSFYNGRAVARYKNDNGLPCILYKDGTKGGYDVIDGLNVCIPYNDVSDWVVVIPYNTNKITAYNESTKVKNTFDETSMSGIYDSKGRLVSNINGFCKVFDATGDEKYSIVNMSTGLRVNSEKYAYVDLETYNTGCMLASLDNTRYMYINSEFNMIKEYKDATAFDNGIAIVLDDNDKAYVINNDFKQCSDSFEMDRACSLNNGLFEIVKNDKTYLYKVD